MSDPPLLQRQRDILHRFRQVLAQRQQIESQAGQRLADEQRDAETTLEHSQQEAAQDRARRETEATQRYQADLAASKATLARVRNESQKRLKQTETESTTLYQEQQQAAAKAQSQTQQAAMTGSAQAKAAATSRHQSETKAAKAALQQAKNEAAVALKAVEKALYQPQEALGAVGLSELIPTQIAPTSVEYERAGGDLTPPQVLAASWQSAVDAAREAEAAAWNVAGWRARWSRRWRWAALVATVLFVLALGYFLLNRPKVRATSLGAHPAASTTVALPTSTTQAKPMIPTTVLVAAQAPVAAVLTTSAPGTPTTRPPCRTAGLIAGVARLNVRRTPNANAAVIGMLTSDTTVEVVDDTEAYGPNAWWHVRGEKLDGWASSNFLMLKCKG